MYYSSKDNDLRGSKCQLKDYGSTQDDGPAAELGGLLHSPARVDGVRLMYPILPRFYKRTIPSIDDVL